MGFFDSFKKAFSGEATSEPKATARMTISADPTADSEMAQMIEAANNTQNPEMFVRVGINYDEGKHVSKDLSKAKMCYKIAADMGNADACYLYATLAFDPQSGSGLDEAGEYLKTAARMGHAESMYKLGMLYVYFKYGWGAGKGYEWWEKAAKLGSAKAQIEVGYAYAQGQGYVDQADHKKACFWCVCAYLHGNNKVKARAQEYLQWAQQNVPNATSYINSLMNSIPKKYPQYVGR